MFAGGIAIALFFGIAFFQLPRTATGYQGRVDEGMMAMLLITAFAGIECAHFIEERKQFYHEEAGGLYHRLAYLVAVVLVQWTFLALAMTVFLCIMLPMSGWLMEYLGNYIGYAISAGFSAVSLYLFVATVSPTITMFMAGFVLVYYFSFTLSGLFPLDSFLFEQHPSVEAFWQWLSPSRMFYIPTIRREMLGQNITCTDSEKFILDSTGIAVRGTGGLAKILLQNATSDNATVRAALNSFDTWAAAGSLANATVFPLMEAARLLAEADEASRVSVRLGNSPDVVSDLAGVVQAAQRRFAMAANVSTADLPAARANDTLLAARLLGFADYLAANPVPGLPICWYGSGEDFLAIGLGLAWYERNATGAIVGYGIDHPTASPDGKYVGIAFATGFAWLALAYCGLWLCNFRQR
ncbi:hypothetical protein DFJ74DRAFT_673697 [Hyaloraphidium curvatum]|nr:hypothetical protein DFJ74DRAFT_673697 [Hyaloraphidium curvatum]